MRRPRRRCDVSTQGSRRSRRSPCMARLPQRRPRARSWSRRTSHLRPRWEPRPRGCDCDRWFLRHSPLHRVCSSVCIRRRAEHSSVQHRPAPHRSAKLVCRADDTPACRVRLGRSSRRRVRHRTDRHRDARLRACRLRRAQGHLRAHMRSEYCSRAKSLRRRACNADLRRNPERKHRSRSASRREHWRGYRSLRTSPHRPLRCSSRASSCPSASLCIRAERKRPTC